MNNNITVKVTVEDVDKANWFRENLIAPHDFVYNKEWFCPITIAASRQFDSHTSFASKPFQVHGDNGEVYCEYGLLNIYDISDHTYYGYECEPAMFCGDTWDRTKLFQPQSFNMNLIVWSFTDRIIWVYNHNGR